MRTTIKELESLVDYLNKVTNSPKGCEVNSYMLDEARGGIGLVRKINSGGGVTTIFHLTTRKELALQIRAFIQGITLNK